MTIQEHWQQAEDNPGTNIPLNNIVVCDICDQDYTESSDQGGFIFGSYAYCPKCAEKYIGKIKESYKEWNIKARCPEGTSFVNFVRAYRGPGAGQKSQRRNNSTIKSN